jgi:hypothetical protein
MWPFRKRGKLPSGGIDGGIEHARRMRIESEERLEHANRTVIRPLREMHDENHVSELLDELIYRARERGSRNDPGPSDNKHL